MYTKGGWEFTKEVVDVFDKHVTQSVPLYNTFHEEITELSLYFTQDSTNVIEIGASTGTLINKIKQHNIKRNISYIGLDNSQAMILECKKRYNDITFKCCDANSYSYENCSLIVSCLAIQFMSLSKRTSVVNQIYNGLVCGGAFIIVEKIRTENLELHDIYNDLYYDFKRKTIDDTFILDKNKSLRGVMKPITLADNVKLLTSVGFSKIDVFMKYNNFVGIIAIK